LLKIKISIKEDKQDDQSSEVERLRCDNTKVMKNTRWKPRYDLTKGLNETISWIKVNLEIYKHYIYNV
jgi:dTDP-glucose 4,6-dehydratase